MIYLFAKFILQKPAVFDKECYFINSDIAWIYGASNSLSYSIYYALALCLFYVSTKRKDLALNGMYLLGAIFFFACGTNNLIEALTFGKDSVNLTNYIYLLSSFWKAIVGGIAAIAFFKIIRLTPPEKSSKTPNLPTTLTELKVLENALWENQRLIQQIAQATPTILYLYDCREGRNIYVNRQVKEILGYSPEDIYKMGRSFIQNLCHPEDWLKVTETIKRGLVIENREIVENEYRMRHSNGEWRWLYCRDTVFTRTADGSPQQILGTAIDITDRKQTEIALRSSEQQLRAVFESAIDAMLIVDDRGRYVTTNPASGELFGLPPQEIIGKTIADFTEVGIDFNQAWETFLTKGRDRGEFRIRSWDGITRDVEYAAIANFVPHRHLSVIRDITQRKQTEAQLKEYRDRLEELVELRTNELKTANEQLKQEISERKQVEEKLRQQVERERLLGAIAQRIRETLDLDEILQTTVAQVRQFLQVDRVLVYRIWPNGTGSTVAEAYENCPAILEMTFSAEVFPQEYHQLYRQGRVRAIVDAEREGLTPCLVEFLQQLGVKSKLVVPILQGENLWGLLIAHHCCQTRQWQSLDIDLLKQLATQVSIAIQQAELYRKLQDELSEHQRTEKALRQSEERLRLVIENAEDLILLHDLEGKCLYYNGPSCYGVTANDIVGKTLFDFLTALEADKIVEQIKQVAASGKSMTVENCITLRGETLCFLTQVFPVRNVTNSETGEEAIAVASICRNISERKKAEDALKESEARFRAIFEQAAVGILTASLDGRYITVNQKFCQMVGYSELELKERNFWDITHPDDLAENKLCCQQLLAGEISNYSLEKRYIRKEGSCLWVYVTVSLVHSSTAEPKYFIGVVKDISDRKQAEAARRESEERFRKIFAEAPIGMAVCKSDGELTQVNRSLCQMLGYPELELIGRNFRDITYPADLEKELPYWEKWVKGKITSYQLEKRYLQKNGDLLLTHLTCGGIGEPDKNIIYGLAMIEDITERKEVERMKDEFISVVSHELRTPMTSLRGALGLLSTGRLGMLNQQGKRLLEFAIEDTDRLVRLLDDILDLERLKSGKLILTPKICDAGDLMRRVIDLMQPIAEKADVTLSVVPISVNLWVDSDRIIQVLTNLLGNAIKFSSQSSTVWLTAQTQGNQTLFQVKDRGRGIPPEKLETIFERFQQVDASDSRQKGGSGLGLAICRSIIEQHGGRIWVESTLGVGSSFYFNLPIQLPDASNNETSYC